MLKRHAIAHRETACVGVLDQADGHTGRHGNIHASDNNALAGLACFEYSRAANGSTSRWSSNSATQRRRNRAWACRFCMWSVVAVMRAFIVSSNNRTACWTRRALELPLELSCRLELEPHPQAPPELHMRHPSINEPATNVSLHLPVPYKQVSGTSPPLLSTRCAQCSNNISAVRRTTRSFCWWLSLLDVVRARLETPCTTESLLSLAKHLKIASRPIEGDASLEHWPWTSFHPYIDFHQPLLL